MEAIYIILSLCILVALFIFIKQNTGRRRFHETEIIYREPVYYPRKREFRPSWRRGRW